MHCVPLQPMQYPLSRPDYYNVAFAAAEASDAKAMLPWQLLAWSATAADTFDFGPDDPTFVTVANAIAYQKNRVGCPAACRKVHLCSLGCTWHACWQAAVVNPSSALL